VIAEVDEDRHAHDVLDAAHARQRLAYQAFSFVIADCSDCANASLVYVAPETM
jgi:hypothetical protein